MKKSIEGDSVAQDKELGGQRRSRQRGPMYDALFAFRRNPVAVVSASFLMLVLILAVAAPWITPYSPHIGHESARNQAPLSSFEPRAFDLERCHWYGTFLEAGCSYFLLGSDVGGTDLWSLVVYGARTSLAVALVASSISLLLGIAYGTFAGYLGGVVDEAMMRFVDFLYALPAFIVALGIQSFFRFAFVQKEGIMLILSDLNEAMDGLLFLFIAIGSVSWVSMARLSRAMVHSGKSSEYVQAARAIGASDNRLLFRHLLPNILGPLIVVETLAIPGYIFLEATLSFLGLGVGAVGSSWGIMIARGYAAIRSHPHIILIPSLALSFVTIAFNFVGDGLRDAVDPRMGAT
ncbi:MAG: ABC transporter permease [Anaerolineales bacterium]